MLSSLAPRTSQSPDFPPPLLLLLSLFSRSPSSSPALEILGLSTDHLSTLSPLLSSSMVFAITHVLKTPKSIFLIQIFPQTPHSNSQLVYSLSQFRDLANTWNLTMFRSKLLNSLQTCASFTVPTVWGQIHHFLRSKLGGGICDCFVFLLSFFLSFYSLTPTPSYSLGKSVSSTFKVYTECDHFLPPLSLLSWSQLPCFSPESWL